MLALGLGAFLGGSEAMAQNGWESGFSQSQTTSTTWEALSTGSTTGKTLGESGTTKYYYLQESLTFTNTNAGGSGLTIKGTVYLYIPYGLTITCVGADASGATGAGAGIELAEGNTLYIIGSGDGEHTTVTAKGGKAANGSNGGNGGNADFVYDSWMTSGTGGKGGDGGGGAGAGIGTRGGNGGIGGNGGEGYYHTTDWKTHNGRNGNNGTNGNTAENMGELFVDQTLGITVSATAGAGATVAGNGGQWGQSALDDDAGNNYSIAGGGGGGGGGFGGAASDIGTGGPGGGGGGGGAGGSIEWADTGFYVVKAYAGSGGYNANGTTAGYGEMALVSWASLCTAGMVKTNGSWSKGKEKSSHGDQTDGTGGSGAGCGGASSAGSTNAGQLKYNITYIPIKTDINGKTGNTPNPLTVTYSPGAPNIVLPANTEGFNWVLQVYGKSCAPNGTPVNTFATATTEYFGGNGDETSRTITPVNVYGDLVFHEVATMLIMECSTSSGESANNNQEIEEFYDYGYNVTTRLQNRTLYRDDHWNTICLPFAMTKTQIAASPLKGATIMKMNESVTGYYPSGDVKKEGYQVKNYGHPIVLFWFDTVDINGSGTVLEAGKPYLVKWTEPYEDPNGIWTDGNYADNGTTRHQLDFPGVTITETEPGSWTGQGTTDGNVTFQGTFSLSANLTKLDASGKMNLVLGANDKLYHPLENDAINVGACRGYFKIPTAAVNAAHEFVLAFDGGETTSIRTVNGSGLTVHGSDTYYNLNGQRLSAPQKGINIVNGKKVIIK